MILTGENRILGEKLVQVPLCPPKVPHGLTWGVRSDRLTNNTGRCGMNDTTC
jgi:hypothetical protein